MRWIFQRSQEQAKRYNNAQEQASREYFYKEVSRARKEWEQARFAFENAVGKDQVDVAIYTLEAAERKYQIQLREAKQANVEWDAFKHGSYFNPSE